MQPEQPEQQRERQEQQELRQRAFAQQQEREQEQLLVSCRKQQHREPGSWLREVTSSFFISLR